jgi:hypothetical protein
MIERSNTPGRLEAAFLTPSGGKAPSQPAVWVERSIRAKESAPLLSATSIPRRMA